MPSGCPGSARREGARICTLGWAGAVRSPPVAGGQNGSGQGRGQKCLGHIELQGPAGHLLVRTTVVASMVGC
eukprot:2085540-Pyramimonas_sp.AAC.1